MALNLQFGCCSNKEIQVKEEEFSKALYPQSGYFPNVDILTKEEEC